MHPLRDFKPFVTITIILVSILYFAAPSEALTVSRDNEQKAHPGETIVFEFTITNDELSPLDIRLEAEEEFPYRFSITEFRLYPGESKTVKFQLTVPMDAIPESHESLIRIYKKEVLNPRGEWLLGPSFNLVTVIEATPTGSAANPGNGPSWLLFLIGGIGIGALLYRWRNWLARFLPVWLTLRFRLVPRISSPVRQKLFDIIKKDPGVGVTALSREMNRDRSTIYYHLWRLHENRQVYRGPRGGWYHCTYKGPHISSTQRRILDEVKNNGNLSQRILARRLRMSQGNVCYHLHKLRGLGLLPE